MGKLYSPKHRIDATPKDTVRSIQPLVGDAWLDRVKLSIVGRSSNPPTEYIEYLYRKEMKVSYEEMMNTPAKVVYADLAIISEEKREEARRQKMAYDEMKREQSRARLRR